MSSEGCSRLELKGRSRGCRLVRVARLSYVSRSKVAPGFQSFKETFNNWPQGGGDISEQKASLVIGQVSERCYVEAL